MNKRRKQNKPKGEGPGLEKTGSRQAAGRQDTTYVAASHLALRQEVLGRCSKRDHWNVQEGDLLELPSCVLFLLIFIIVPRCWCNKRDWKSAPVHTATVTGRTDLDWHSLTHLVILYVANEVPTVPVCSVSCSACSLPLCKHWTYQKATPLQTRCDLNFHMVVSPLFFPCNILPFEQTPPGQFLKKETWLWGISALHEQAFLSRSSYYILLQASCPYTPQRPSGTGVSMSLWHRHRSWRWLVGSHLYNPRVLRLV